MIVQENLIAAPGAGRLQVKAVAEGRRIIITGPQTSQLQEMIDQLPNGKWNRTLLAWTCDLTPAAAWRVVGHKLGISCDQRLEDAAQKFRESLAPLPSEQPDDRSVDLWEHQVKGYWHSHNRDAAGLDYYMGCVSCDTEFLTPTGWKRIDSYEHGDLVGQYEPKSGEVTFVQPTGYSALPCDEMIHFKHTRGMDQLLSPEHRVLCVDQFGGLKVRSAEDVANATNGTAGARFPSCFTLTGGTPIGLSESHLRLQIAVMADGHFPPYGKKCRVNLKKKRKIDRLVMLLAETGVEYKESPGDDGYRVFVFVPPIRTKLFDQRFWQSSYEDRKIICDECVHWDGSQGKSNGVNFHTTVRENADFIQFAFSSTGRRASLCIADRTESGKPVEYCVHAVGTGRSGNLIQFATYQNKQNARRVPSIDGKKYFFEVPTSFLVYRRNNCVFASGNTGKSCITVHAVAAAKARKVLILCPTAVRGVWRREFRKFSPAGYKPEVLVLDRKSWTVARKAKAAKEFIHIMGVRNVPAVVVINYESAWRPDFEKFSLGVEWDFVICDESHRIRNPQANASKYAAKLTPVSRKRLALSGTPMAQSPLDIFGQMRFLDPGVFGTSWSRFRNHFAVSGPFGADHIVSYKNQEELAEKTALLWLHAGKECLKNLPPTTSSVLEGELSPESRKVYQDLEQELFAEVRGGVITVANALTKLLRLAQITSGFINVQEIDPETGATTGLEKATQLGNEKIEILCDLLEDIPADEPVVVFCRFKEDLARIQSLAEKLGRAYGEISGRRRDLTQDSTMPEWVQLMGVQIQSGGVGIDLTRACYVVHYSPTYSLSDHEQSLARCHRPGQTRHTHFWQIVLRGTADEVIYRALQKRRDIIEEVMGYLKSGRPLDPEVLLE